MLEPHPLSERYPLMEGDEFSAMLAGIRANGLKNPIWLFEGKVLDGRNRLRACREAKVEPVFAEFVGTAEEAAAFVVSQNEHRRHLSPEWRRERVRELRGKGMSTREIAKEMGVPKSTVSDDLSGVRNRTPAPQPAPAEAKPQPAPRPPPERVNGRDGKSYSASKPAKKTACPKPSPEVTSKPTAPSEKPAPPVWVAIAETLNTLATQIEQLIPTPSENERPWELIKSLEGTAASLLRQANRLRRRHHL